MIFVRFLVEGIAIALSVVTKGNYAYFNFN